MVTFVSVIVAILVVAFLALLPLFCLMFLGEVFLNHFPFGRPGRFLLIVLKSLRRNLLRTSLTYLAAFVLVIVVTLVWSVLYYLDAMMSEKSKDLKVIITERWEASSQMPWAYATPLSEGAARSGSQDVRPQDSMTWQFYIGTTDALKRKHDDGVFFIALEPGKILTMMDSVFDDFSPVEAKQRLASRLEQLEQCKTAVQKMKDNKRAVIIGRERLEALNKRVGERFKLTGINYPGLDLEFEIVGVFPKGRYDQNAVMNRDYLNDALERFRTPEGLKHPLVNKSLNMVWLQVRDQKEFSRVADQIETSSHFQNPAVKCETLAAGVTSWLGAYSDLIWGMRWLLSPAVLATMTLVIANSISISVRERRMEMAVLKVLGFRPAQILLLVLGEAMLIGALSGLLSAATTYVAINHVLKGVSPDFPIFIPDIMLWQGLAIGALTGLIGSAVPAWAACRVRVSEVFARVT